MPQLSFRILGQRKEGSQRRGPTSPWRLITLKTIIFTQFERVAWLINRALSEILSFTPIFVITGSTKDKETQLKAFEACDKAILVATDCLKEGHNLQTACNVINYDLPWNPTDLQQRISRVHRQGQTNVVTVTNIIVGDFNNVELRVKEILKKKTELQEALIHDTIGSVSS